MKEYFKLLGGWIVFTSLLTFLIWLVNRNVHEAFSLTVVVEVIFAFFLKSQYDDYRKEFKKRCCQYYNAILTFMVEQAQAQRFGTDLAIPSGLSDLTLKSEPSCIQSDRFSMELRFKTVKRTPLSAADCNQKKMAIQSDINWAVQQGILNRFISVKNVYNDGNDVWVVLEVIP